MKQLKDALVDVSPVMLDKLVSQMSRDGYIENTPKVRWKGTNFDSEHPMFSFSYFLVCFSEHDFLSTPNFPITSSSNFICIT